MNANLHGDQSVVHHHLFSQEVSSDCGLILITELIIHILVHQRGLPNSVKDKQDHALETRAADALIQQRSEFHRQCDRPSGLSYFQPHLHRGRGGWEVRGIP